MHLLGCLIYNRMKTFEEYLKDCHADNYMGTDDDMSDKFETWLGQLDVDDILSAAEDYRKVLVRTLQEEVKQIKGVYSAHDALTKVDELLESVLK